MPFNTLHNFREWASSEMIITTPIALSLGDINTFTLLGPFYWNVLHFFVKDDQSTERGDSNPLKSHSHRQLSARVLKQRAQSKMSEQNRTKGQIYQALNVEEEDDEDDEGNGLREAENATEIEEPRRRRKEVEPLSSRLKKLRHSRYVRPCEISVHSLVSF